MQEEQVVLSPGEWPIWQFLDCLFIYTGKDKKDKNEKKAAFNPTTGKDKKEGKQKLQASKEEVIIIVIVVNCILNKLGDKR